MVDIDSYILYNKTQIFKDNRGYSYQNYLYDNYININFVQELHSVSKKNVIRGLHYQWDKPLAKLIRVSKGSIFDVIVDINSKSKNFGKIYTFVISEKNLNQLFIPPWYAHGFLSLEDDTHVQYKFTQYYNSQGEDGIYAFDKTLNINWGVEEEQCILSERDKNLKSYEVYLSNKRF